MPSSTTVTKSTGGVYSLSTGSPAVLNDGDTIVDTNYNSLTFGAGGMGVSSVGMLASQYGNVTVSNTLTETDLLTSASVLGTRTLAANYLVAGKVIRVKASGYYSSSAQNPTLRFRLRVGGIAGTVVLDSTAIAAGVSTSNRGWKFEGNVLCQTTGATGTVLAQGRAATFQTATGVTEQDMVNTATQTIDTTASQQIALSVQWSEAVAGNTITVTFCTIESV